MAPLSALGRRGVPDLLYLNEGGRRFREVGAQAGLEPRHVDHGLGAVFLDANRDGRLDLDHFRGRSCWPMPVQAAEIALRRALGHTALYGIRLLRRRAEGDLRVVDLEADGRPRTVTLRRRESEPVLLTCHARRAEPAVGWDVVSITD